MNSFSRIVLLLTLIPAWACSDTDPATAHSNGTIVTAVMGPLLGGATLRIAGIELRARAQCVGCVQDRTVYTDAEGVARFDNLEAGSAYRISVTLPDSLRISEAQSAEQIVTVRPNAVDSIKFKLQFAPRDTVLTLIVAPRDTSCAGVTQQRCMFVRKAPSQQFELFYDHINGFVYEPGYTYELVVRRSRRPDVLADQGLYVWNLVDYVRRTPM